MTENNTENQSKEDLNKEEEVSKETEDTNNKDQEASDFETKFNELNDKYLRLLAENQNIRRTHQNEKEDILKYGSFNFAQQILSLTDNLGRAFQIFKDDKKFKTDEFKSILDGIEMIEKELNSTLEKNNIKYIECINKKFDPNLHQAVGEIESDQDAGIVLEEVQKGYQLHERLLRPSMVMVSKKASK